jgi:hypothetical protein
LDLRNLIDLGGFLQGLQDTRKDLKITKKARGLDANRSRASSSSGQGQWRADLSNPQWTGDLGAQRRRGTEREGEGKLGEVLTGGRDVEGRPESGVNAELAGSVWRWRSSGAPAVGGAAGHARARALALYSHAGPSVRSVHAEAKGLAAAAQACWPWPLARWASCGPVDGPTGRVRPTGSAQSGRIGFFRLYF